MSIGSFLSREWKFAEASLIQLAAVTITKNASSLNALIDADAPATAAALVAAIEKDDAKLGPVAAGVINLTLNSYASEIEAELATLGDSAAPLVTKLATALSQVAAKLQAEAEATT